MPAIEHVVLLKFKPTTSEKTIKDLYRQLEELKGLIPGIRSFVGGPYSSDEGLNQGYTHGFVMEFESAKHRDNYLPHPEHERVKSAIIPNIDGVVAFDFELPWN
jgi:hypothetical protein